jgi:CheY-like chemotaxis protein
MASSSGQAQKRILFVDDDPNVIQRLRRLLNIHRQQWDMSFTTSPAEALDLVKQRSLMLW